MHMIDEGRLSELLSADVELHLVEAHIYSVYPDVERANDYDENVGFYDRVIGNRTYNRIMWGYDSTEFINFTQAALKSREAGWVLDAGCGSLVFTAQAYADFSMRPVVFLDQSIEMLRAAKTRLVELRGDFPPNMVFVQGDILGLPFKTGLFSTVISLGVLHVLKEGQRMISELKRVLAEGGSFYLTSLVTGRNLGDRYLRFLHNSGGVTAPRSREDVLAIFAEQDLPVRYELKGNMMFTHVSRS